MISIEHDCVGTLPGGFFSKFLVVLDWVHNSIYRKEKVYVDWSCKKNLSINLWDLFFEQPNLSYDDTGREFRTDHYRYMNYEQVYENIDKVFPLFHEFSGRVFNNIEIFKRGDFQSMRDEYNKAWKLITVKQQFLNSLGEFNTQIDENTLGITVRIPLHYCLDVPEGVPLSRKVTPERYYDLILNELIERFRRKEFQKIFVACDVQYFIDLLVLTFGQNRIIYTKYPRIKTLNSDWNKKNLPLEKEYEFVLRDVLLLSKCNYIMGGSSNIFTSSLLINNKAKFEFFNILKNLYAY